MENASKALILAGSVIIAVMLVSLGVYIFTSAQPSTHDIESEAAKAFNVQFNNMANGDKTKNEVNAFLNGLNVDNLNSDHVVEVDGDVTGDAVTGYSLGSGTTFKITITGRDAVGYITEINIQKAS